MSCTTGRRFCRAIPEARHISTTTTRSSFGVDWISHRLYWERLHPYSKEEKDKFAKCDHFCPGEEHDSDPSYCIRPLFHPQAYDESLPHGGYMSKDGHVFKCQDPSPRTFHVIFVIDRSSSMQSADNVPSPRYPRIANIHDNRYGAVLVALNRFLAAREAISFEWNKDAYSCILFNTTIEVPFFNDNSSTRDELLDKLIERSACGGTDFGKAIQTAKDGMIQSWDSRRCPVIIFLSDGECLIEDSVMQNLCDSALEKGHPLAFFSITFGNTVYANTLKRMASIAREAYRTARPQTATIPCKYSTALDSVRLEETFLDIAEALRVPKNARSKRALEARAPKEVESERTAIFVKGSHTGEVIKEVIKDLMLLKRPHAISFSKKNIIHPFEPDGISSLEFWSTKNDATFFVVGTSTKKRPNTLTFVRTFDGKVLDMCEVGVTKFIPMEDFKTKKSTPGYKPLMHFASPLFDTHPRLMQLRSLLLCLFNGEAIDKIALAGIEHVISVQLGPLPTTNASTPAAPLPGSVDDDLALFPPIFIRTYTLSLKSSSTR
ncbi:rRNA-binding ribosome biosynthesis protein rpf2, partial [Serendipita sp. 399]